MFSVRQPRQRQLRASNNLSWLLGCPPFEWYISPLSTGSCGRGLLRHLPRQMFAHFLCLLPTLSYAASAFPLTPRGAPAVQLDQGTFIGTTDGTTNKFLGIPFAQPPCVFPAGVGRRGYTNERRLLVLGIFASTSPSPSIHTHGPTL